MNMMKISKAYISIKDASNVIPYPYPDIDDSMIFKPNDLSTTLLLF